MDTDNNCYELNTGCYAVYGFEYKPGFEADNGVCPPTWFSAPVLRPLILLFSFPQYITWINNNQSAWTMKAAGVAADPRVNIGPRPVPQEPMVRVIFIACHPHRRLTALLS